MIDIQKLETREQYMYYDFMHNFLSKPAKMEETLKELRGNIAKELEEDNFSRTLEYCADKFFTTCETDRLIEKLENYGYRQLSSEELEKYRTILKQSVKFSYFTFAKCNMVSYARIMFYQFLQRIKEVSK